MSLFMNCQMSTSFESGSTAFTFKWVLSSVKSQVILKMILSFTETIEIQGEKPQKSEHPPYSPNAWAELAHFLARDPSCEYFRTHRGDF